VNATSKGEQSERAIQDTNQKHMARVNVWCGGAVHVRRNLRNREQKQEEQ